MAASASEVDRIAALQRYRILDTPPEIEFNDVAFLAAQLCGTPAAQVNFVDGSRVWFKASVGTPPQLAWLPRDLAFCSRAIAGEEDHLIVPDAALDEHFSASPLVVNPPSVRYYFGVVLVTTDKQRLGTVCVLDVVPRQPSAAQIEALRRLARQVTAHLERRLMQAELQRQLEASRAAELTLRASEEFKSRIIECSRDCIKVLDLEGRLIFMNAGGMAAVGMCDWAPFVNANWIEFWHPDHRAEATEAVRAAGAGEFRRFVGFFTDLRGVGKWWDCAIVGIKGPDGRVEKLLAISRDVTELRKAADLLQAITEGTAAVTGRDFYRSLARHVATALNVRSCLVTERRPDHRVRSLAFWSGGSLAENFGYALQDSPCAEVLAGAVVHCDETLPARFPGWQALVVPGAVGYLGVPILDSRKKVVGHVAVMHDAPLPNDPLVLRVLETFASRVGAEIERSQAAEQLRQVQKMEAIGRLAAGVAHDFNNILTVIKGNASLLRLGGLSASERTDALAEIVQASDHATNLTKQLLTFSRQQQFEPRNLDLNEAFGHVVKMLMRLIGENITLETDFSPEKIHVHADPSMMEQVLFNLALNARDAMPTGGRLILRTESVTLHDGPFLESRGVPAGNYVRVTVADTGTGISAKNLPRIFEPFFSTKPEGQGTGLGLATVFGIAQQHHGFVDVQSELGNGAVFSVYLPSLTGVELQAVPQAPPVPAPAKGRGMILLVEDEASVRNLMRLVLERDGYQVVAADSGAAALEVWRGQKANIDLVITDTIMPGVINGLELGRLLCSEKPELKVIHCSGYSRERAAGNVALSATAAHLAKPFDTAELLQLVRRQLEAP